MKQWPFSDITPATIAAWARKGQWSHIRRAARLAAKKKPSNEFDEEDVVSEYEQWMHNTWEYEDEYGRNQCVDLATELNPKLPADEETIRQKAVMQNNWFLIPENIREWLRPAIEE